MRETCPQPQACSALTVFWSNWNFVNASDATLEAGFVADETVTAIQARYAKLSGTLALRPMADFYASDQKIHLKNPLRITESDSGFRTVSLTSASSPTLAFDLVNEDIDSLQVNVSRLETAYSQYAQNSGSSGLGRSLANIGKMASTSFLKFIKHQRILKTSLFLCYMEY